MIEKRAGKGVSKASGLSGWAGVVLLTQVERVGKTPWYKQVMGLVLD